MRLIVLGVALGAAIACAKQGDPPGGPPDTAPPQILSLYPDTGAVQPDLHGDAVIQYDEVIDEMGTSGGGFGSSRGGATSVGGLGAHILLSPVVGPVKVSWHRSAIHVKPEEGWKPDRVYHLEILPGIADLRHNLTKQRTSVVFSTGPPIPSGVLSGYVLHWTEQHALVGGLIRAARLPDSAAYLGVADSTGHYRLEHLPPGRYVVMGVQDQNNNRQRDRREAYDSVLVGLDTTVTTALWVFTHDTLGPRLRSADPLDSITFRVTFSQPLDPALPLDSLGLRVLALPDSTPLTVHATLTAAQYDSLTTRERARADSARAAADTTHRAAPDTTKPRPAGPDTTHRAPRDTTRRAAAVGAGTPGQPAVDTTLVHRLLSERPVPQDKLTVRMDTLLAPGGRYYVEVATARNLNGATQGGGGHIVLIVPKKAPVDSTKNRPTPPRTTPRPP